MVNYMNNPFSADPLKRHDLHKFALLFVPRTIINNLHVFLSAFLVSLIPYTPINFCIFVVTFILIYSSNIFGLADKVNHYCRYNQAQKSYQPNVWIALKNTYLIYLFIAILVNYNSIFLYQHQMLSVRE